MSASHAALFSLFIFFFIFSIRLSCSAVNNNTISFCPETEKRSLLSLKQYLEDPNNHLSSWDDEVNCCSWKGVSCNNFTGGVDGLRVEGVKGKINPSLLNLHHLKHLDVSNNDFSGNTIPSFMGSLPNLQYLNLSGSGFHGNIPQTLGNLSNLQTLDLEAGSSLHVDSLEWVSRLSQLEYLNMNDVNLSKAKYWPQEINSLPRLLELHLDCCSLDFMAPMAMDDVVNITTPLQHLFLSDNNLHYHIFLAGMNVSYQHLYDNYLTKKRYVVDNYQSYFTIPPWIFQLTNLRYLDLSRNGFIGPIPTVSNATKLQHIDLSNNHLNSTIPDWIYLCKHLEFIDLSVNILNGTISNSIANLTSLNTLLALSNHLSGNIPREIANLCKMQMLELSFNNFQGELSDSFGNMSKCFLETMELMSFWSNDLSGHLKNQFEEFKRLQYLNLGFNSLSGEIPLNIGNVSSLKVLVLHSNKFNGTIPESLGQLFNLKLLCFADNKLQGVVTETHFSNLTKLDTLFVSENHLTLKVSPDWNPPFRLKVLHMRSWKLNEGSQIPSWLEMQRNTIEDLDLSDTGISGSVPAWFWNIQVLILSENHLQGNIPYLSGPKDQYIYLGSNQFSGSLPRIANTVRHLDLSNNSFSGGLSHFLCDKTYETYGLSLLNLEGNKLLGELPDCWMKWPTLIYLNLGNNNISGRMPNSLGYLGNLKSLNLYRNRLSGEIPFSLHNCSELVKMDLSDNDLGGDLPAWMGRTLLKLTFLILHSNKLSGNISLEICHLSSLQILNLSDNEFTGVIPRCLYNFTGMSTKRSLVLYKYSYSFYLGMFTESASVVTKGSEVEYDTILELVTNLDLSENKLSGDIPAELTRLVELRSLNLSGNHLTGSIPQSIGDMMQLESLDLSRNSLSGQIPDSLTLVSSLNHLNLSHNKLIGRIPESTQLQSLGASSFADNNLCGPPLSPDCSNEDDGLEKEGMEEDEESKIEWFYVLLSVGYAVGLSAVCSALVLNKTWRDAYFGFLQYTWDKLYVCFHIRWNKTINPTC